MYYNLLKDGRHIKVYDKKGNYTATTFYLKDGLVYYNNDELGYNCKHDDFSAKKGRFNVFIANMLKKGFSIDIQ